MATETDRLAKSVVGDTPTEIPVLTLRMGEVKDVNGILGMVDITLGGASGDELIPGVRHLSNYRPQIDDACWVLVSGPDLLVIDRTSVSGPSVISDANSALVDPEETRTSWPPSAPAVPTWTFPLRGWRSCRWPAGRPTTTRPAAR
jgi:hypothetical protein